MLQSLILVRDISFPDHANTFIEIGIKSFSEYLPPFHRTLSQQEYLDRMISLFECTCWQHKSVIKDTISMHAHNYITQTDVKQPWKAVRPHQDSIADNEVLGSLNSHDSYGR